MEEALEQQNSGLQIAEQSSDKKHLEFTSKPVKKRIWEIDLIRGLCVLLMIVDHIMYDVWYFGGIWKNADMRSSGISYWNGDLRAIAWSIVVFLFFFIAGISSTFSKSNFSRALQAIAFAYIITVVSSFIPDVIDIKFGVLHALGFSMLIYAILDSFDKSIYSKLAIGLCIITMSALMHSRSYLELCLLLIITGFLMLITFGVIKEKRLVSKYTVVALSLIATGILIFIIKGLVSDAVSFKLPSNFQWFNNVIGYPEPNFSTTDYFPLIPFSGIFLLGSVFAKLFYNERKSLLPKLDTKFTKPVEFVGRYALWIYVLHQVLIYGIFVLISVIYGLPF